MMDHVVLSCEHAGRRIPSWLDAHLFIPEDVLSSHRGWDLGSLEVAELIGKKLGVRPIVNDVSRLAIDANRSRHNRSLWSPWSRPLDPGFKERLFTEVYHPHRKKVEEAVRSLIQTGGRVLHVSVHSFTPVFHGIVRKVDMAWLYDSRRTQERDFCRVWARQFGELCPDLSRRFNAPYRGSSDGLTTVLRRVFSESEYLGIEVEVNQKFAADREHVRNIGESLGTSLHRVRNCDSRVEPVP